MLPVLGHPVLYYPISTLVKSGCHKIIVVTNGPHANQVASYCSALNFPDVEVTCLIQKEGWIAEALEQIKPFTESSPFFLASGDNITDHDFSDEVKAYSTGACIFFKKVRDPSHYGIAVFSKDGKLTEIEEKPKQPKSNLALTDYFLLDTKFFDYLKMVDRSGRGEKVIASILNNYITNGNISWKTIPEYWVDTGRYNGLINANAHFLMRGLINN